MGSGEEESVAAAKEWHDRHQGLVMVLRSRRG